MSKKILCLILVGLLINLMTVSLSYAESKVAKEAKHAAKVKSEISKLGTGTDARIEVKLKDKTKLKGYVSQINENSFVVIDEKTGVSTEIPYPRAKQIKGNNLSTGVKIAIVAAIILTVVSIVGAVSPD